MIKNNHLRILFICFAYLFLAQNCFAGVLSNWDDSGAYKPNPVLFLHGFAKGNSADWDYAEGSLSKYFVKYSGTYAYLETINFLDPNGSIDIYDPGKLNPQENSKGWSDKVEGKVNELLASSKYGAYTTKLNLVCHSMGGLAARWYLVNYSNNYVDKLILIGVPNLGTNWATLANAASKVSKVGWLDVLSVSGYASLLRDELDTALSNLSQVDIYGEAVDDMDPESTGSGFLAKLNNKLQPQNISYYGAIGIIGNPMNWVISGHYFGGDCIVSEKSQLGTGRISYKQFATIHSNHWREPEIVSQESDNKILQFLDSTKPELEIAYPDPAKITEISSAQINIQGTIYKEYLPADSKLTITVTREEDGYSFTGAYGYLRPSDLWIANNPGSPVAEFDELINFPGSGTYRIICQVKNPAGLMSDTKETRVKVTLEGSYIVVHCHNPEGKEIAGIDGMDGSVVQIYDNGKFLSSGPYAIGTHNSPMPSIPGTHVIKAMFNGMSKEQTITLNANQTKMVILTFGRTSKNYKEFWYLSPTGSISGSGADEGFIGGGVGKFFFETSDYSGPRSLLIQGYVHGSSGCGLYYNVNGSASIGIEQHNIILKANISGHCKGACDGGNWLDGCIGPNKGAKIIMLWGALKYVNIPQPTGFTKWIYQGIDNETQEYLQPRFIDSTTYTESIGSTSYVYPETSPFSEILQPELDAILASVPYDCNGSGI